MKYTADRPFADPANAARKLLETANETDAEQDGRIHIEKINGPFLFRDRGSPAEYGAGWPMRSRRAGCGITNPAPM